MSYRGWCPGKVVQMVKSLREEIADALVEGLGGPGSCSREEVTELHVPGHEEPIRVLSDDVILPDWAEPLAPGIRLDVQAILADREVV